jgi:hypothetical protein
MVGHNVDGGQTSAPAPPAVAGAAVEPDLDALARQVYGIVRRRLAAEQRRSR